MNSEQATLVEKIKQEHTRGSLTLAVLALLKEPRYGYALVERLNRAGIDASGDTLYPLLRRLERQGLLESSWIIDDSTRPRKYYQLSPEGVQVLPVLSREWLTYAEKIKEILT